MYWREFTLPGLRPLTPTRVTEFNDVGRGLREQQDFGANPGNLRMYLYAPSSLPKNAPLVVVLHGCTQNASSYDDGAGWTRLASQFGFAVLAPEQVRENNPNLCFNWFLPGDTARGQGEAASIRQMIDWAVTTHGLDRSRIFITGLSAGGAMTGVLLAAYPEVFSAGAIIAGLPVGSATNIPEALASMRHAPQRLPEVWGKAVRSASSHSGPWPRVSIWHGSADMTVHPSNAEALILQWTHLLGVGQTPARDEVEKGHRHRSWLDPDGKVAVEAIILAGMGHGTPVAPRENIGKTGPHFLDVGVSSTTQIAYSWGLAKPVVGRTQSTGPKPAADYAEGIGIRNTILKALQSAGLIKSGDGRPPR